MCIRDRHVALALAPRACFLKVALPHRRSAHVSFANSSGARGLPGPPGTSWGMIVPLGASPRPRGFSWGLLKLPGAS
eukprot:2825743-Pyramimonas_sp.AAC.1